MQLKVIGDGTPGNTSIIQDGTTRELRGFKEVQLNVGSVMITSIKVSDISVLIDPNRPYDKSNYLFGVSSTNDFWLKIVGDGKGCMTTAVLDEETNEQVEGVTEIRWEYDPDLGCNVLYMDVENILYDIQPKRAYSRPLTIGGGGGITISGVSSSSPSMSPSMLPPNYPVPPYGNSSNPYQNPNSTCPPPGSGPGSSAPPPTTADPMLPFDQTLQPTSQCDHSWIEVGFSRSKKVCKFCDIEKS